MFLKCRIVILILCGFCDIMYALISNIYEAIMLINSIIDKQAIDKGWSGDKKYSVKTKSGEKYLLRISPLEKQERRKREFTKMREVAAIGIPMAKPIEIGICDEGVYTIESFIEGFDAEEYICKLSSEQQYNFGLDAGRILAKIHTIPAPPNITSWETRFNAKIDRKIAMYLNCELQYDNGQLFLDYVRENRNLLTDRPQTYQHGDYHIGNMMIDKNNVLNVIDFDRDDFGDPWEEFNRIVWCAGVAPAFASGMVDGYFDCNVPLEFWKLLSLYICTNTLSSLPWAIPFGEGEIQTMKDQANKILKWYKNMTNIIPTWYEKR